MAICALVQVRMSSKRLPGKVLYHVSGKPLLQYLMDRLSQCREIDDVIICTSTDPTDNPIADFCEKEKITCFRGCLENVAKRFREAMDYYSFDGYVRISGDSPMLDGKIVDQVIRIYHQKNIEFVTNKFPRTFPKGQSVEVLSRDLYLKHYPLFKEKEDFEHVTAYFYRNCRRISLYNLPAQDRSYGNFSLTIDDDKDMVLFEKMVECMDTPFEDYSWLELVKLKTKVLDTI